jgi:hypothetical protein
MAKTTKTTGYLVKIEAFVIADLTDAKPLQDLQETVRMMRAAFQDRFNVTITPTRR